jgi:hypothetical protein
MIMYVIIVKGLLDAGSEPQEVTPALCVGRRHRKGKGL